MPTREYNIVTLHRKIQKDDLHGIDDYLTDDLVNATSGPYERNALHVVAIYGCKEVMVLQKIIRLSEDVNAKDFGATALIYAAQYAHLEVVTALVEHPNIDLTVRDQYGSTALDYAHALDDAHKNNKTEIVKLLGGDAKVVGGGAAVGGGSERPFGTLKL